MKKVLFILFSLFLLFSCDKKDSCLDDGGSYNEKTGKCEYNIITSSIVPISSITKNILGEVNYKIKTIIPAGVSPHSFDLKARNVLDLEKSNLVISLGLNHIDAFLDKKIKNKNNLKLASFVELIENSNKKDKHEEEHKHEHKHNHKKEHKHEEEHEHKHNHKKDPHIWTSPKNAKIFALKIKDALSLLEPSKKEIFEKNYNNFIKDLDKIKTLFLEKTKGKQEKYFIVFHDAYNYLFLDLGIDSSKKLVFRPSVLNEPNSKDMKKLLDKIKENNIKIAFVEPQFKNGNLEKLAKANNIKIFILDPIGQDDSAKGYLENLKNNLKSLENIYE